MKMRSSSAAEGVADGVFAAVIDTHTAQHTLGVFHAFNFDHGVNIQAHGAVAGAGFAVRAGTCICFEPQGGPGQAVAQPASDHHEGCHPAGCMAESAATDEDCQPGNKRNHTVVDDIGKDDRAVRRPCNRDSVDHIQQQVYLAVAAGTDGHPDNQGYPGDPDDPFDPVNTATVDGFAVDRLNHFLQTGSRADPAAPQASQKKGGDEHESEHHQAAVDDALRGTIDDDIRGEEVHCDRKGEECQDDDGFADSLAHWQLF